MLLLKLQPTLYREILSRLIGCPHTHTHQLWDCLFSYFQKQTHARAHQLCVELHVITLNAPSILDYLLKIRTIVDTLGFIGDPLPSSHHINVILESFFPSDYASVVSVIKSKFDFLDLEEVEILVVAHELRLAKFKKISTLDFVSLNINHIVPSSPGHVDFQTSSYEPPPPPQVIQQTPEYNYLAFRGTNLGLRGRNGRGKGG